MPLDAHFMASYSPIWHCMVSYNPILHYSQAAIKLHPAPAVKMFFLMDSTPLDIALWVKHSRWPPFVQGQAIHSYYFQHNRGSFVFLVSIMGFLGMPYIMVLSEDILDIALWVKNPRWPPFLY